MSFIDQSLSINRLSGGTNNVLHFLNEIQGRLEREINILNGRREMSLNFIVQNDILGGDNNTHFLSSINDVNSLLQSSLLERSVYKYVLSVEGEKQLKSNIYRSDGDNLNTYCAIYHVDFKEGDIITTLPCGHSFIPEAINSWLINEKAECPVCRDKLLSMEVRMTNNEIFGMEDEGGDDDNSGEDDNRGEVINMYDSEEDDISWAIMASVDSLAQEEEKRNKEKRD